MAAKHLATFPLFATHPITGEIETRRRIGTGYINKPEDVDRRREQLEPRGHPVRLRWRNEDCRREYQRWAAGVSKQL